MRKWCVTVAMGALLALPLCAQQKDASTASSTNGKTDNTATATTPATDFSIAPASPTLFAMPAAAAANPADIFSDWDNNPWNRRAWGLLTPKFELAGLFQYVNYMPGSGFPNFNSFGATGAFTYNANKWLGLTAEIGGYHFKRQIYGPPDSSGVSSLETSSGSFQSYLFGPRINLKCCLAPRTPVRNLPAPLRNPRSRWRLAAVWMRSFSRTWHGAFLKRTTS
jgi:hypothetical protein